MPPVASFEEELKFPSAVVKRLIKSSIEKYMHRQIPIEKDALLAFSASATVWITYLTAIATEVMKERKRSTLSVEDLFSALNETDFGDFVEPLQQFLQEYKEQQSKKKEAKWEQKQAELGNHVAAQGTKPPGDDDYGMEEEPESGNVDGVETYDQKQQASIESLLN
jgi:DNA polymerase epsilon subunit 3